MVWYGVVFGAFVVLRQLYLYRFEIVLPRFGTFPA
jgi:hypothetical protein